MSFRLPISRNKRRTTSTDVEEFDENSAFDSIRVSTSPLHLLLMTIIIEHVRFVRTALCYVRPSVRPSVCPSVNRQPLTMRPTRGQIPHTQWRTEATQTHTQTPQLIIDSARRQLSVRSPWRSSRIHVSSVSRWENSMFAVFCRVSGLPIWFVVFITSIVCRDARNAQSFMIHSSFHRLIA